MTSTSSRPQDVERVRLVLTFLALAVAVSFLAMVATVLIWRGAPVLVVAVGIGVLLGVAARGWRLLYRTLDI